MKAVVVLVVFIGYIAWSACLPHFKVGTLRYVQGFNLLSMVQNYVFAPMVLVKVFGLWSGLIATVVCGVFLPTVLCLTLSRLVNMAIGWNEDTALAIFNVAFMLNIAAAVTSLFLR